MLRTRFSQSLYDDYKAASDKHGLEMSDIANRAIRKFRSSELDVATLPNLEVATTNPITIRLQYDISAKDFKKILAWYLPQYEHCKKPVPLDIPDQASFDHAREQLRKLSLKLMDY